MESLLWKQDHPTLWINRSASKLALKLHWTIRLLLTSFLVTRMPITINVLLHFVSQQLWRQTGVSPSKSFALFHLPHGSVSLPLLRSIVQVIQPLLTVAALHDHLRSWFPAFLVNGEQATFLGGIARVRAAAENLSEDCGVFEGHAGAA